VAQIIGLEKTVLTIHQRGVVIHQIFGNFGWGEFIRADF
jgi:hypothetical protein